VLVGQQSSLADLRDDVFEERGLGAVMSLQDYRMMDTESASK